MGNTGCKLLAAIKPLGYFGRIEFGRTRYQKNKCRVLLIGFEKSLSIWVLY
jgi:hypothetical protein